MSFPKIEYAGASSALDEDIPFEFRGRGRPRKKVAGRNIKIVTAADSGFTRRELYECLRLAEVPDDEGSAIMTLPHKEKDECRSAYQIGPWRRGAVDNDAHVRLPRELFDALAKHAKHQGKSASALVVELIDIASGQLLDRGDRT